ncbi:MAG TPA: hypothetical protein VF361_03145 [Candidatus Limnocylindrales bacterium]
MKRGTDRGDSSALNARDEEPQGPLAIERLTSQGRHRQFGWRFPVGLFVTIALVALAGRAVAWRETSTEVVPAGPTPISWVNAIVPSEDRPVGLTTYAAGGQSVVPIVLQSVAVEAIPDSLFWTAEQPNHFTVRVTNTTSQPILLTPCPTYRMYVLGTSASLATVRTINCADIGSTFGPGQVISLDMVYMPSGTDPRGFQTITWEAISGFAGTALLTSIDISD